MTLRIASALLVELILKVGAETEREGKIRPFEETGC